MLYDDKKNFFNSKVYEILKTDMVYSNLLKDISNPPKKLFAIGNIGLLNSNAVAIVGSRNSSEYGEKMTEMITKELVQNDIVIISGMANGIDAIAHKVCIENGGKTIAVLGSGFNYIYPKENEKLFYQIIESGGLVLSEYPVSTPVTMKNFPKRNRIISGLSLGIVVIEAAYRSGTSITAKFAKSQGRKVFCIPHSVGDKNSFGTIRLIQNGAILVRNGEDILKKLGLSYNKEFTKNKLRNMKNQQLCILDEKSKKIVECIRQNKNMDAEKISIKTGINITLVNSILTMLEMEEIIVYKGRNGYDVAEAYYE